MIELKNVIETSKLFQYVWSVFQGISSVRIVTILAETAANAENLSKFRHNTNKITCVTYS